MREKIKIVIEHIEENYHDPLSKELIESITGTSIGYFRNVFKLNVGVSLDKYRIRRSLTLIINKIKKDKINIINGDLLPWKNNKSFSESFKKEFGVTPGEYLKSNTIELQEKFSIDKLIKEDKTIKSLLRKCGSYENALVYLLKLPVYRVRGLNCTSFKNKEDLYDHLIWSYSRDNFSKKNYNIYDDATLYKIYEKNIKKYYDLEHNMEFKDRKYEKDNSTIAGVSLNDFMKYSYFLVDRKLILKLIKAINIEKFFNIINFKKIKTIWQNELINKRCNVQESIIYMPNELTTIMCKLNSLQYKIMNELIIMENGYCLCNDFEEVKNQIKYNYNKRIHNEILCDTCNYKKVDNITNQCIFSNDDECEGYNNLTEEEEERFFKEEYEILTTKELFEEILQLFRMGILTL